MTSPKREKPRTLRNRVLWLFSALALAPFLLASLVQYRQAEVDADRAAAAVAESLAGTVVARMDRIRSEATTDALSFARALRESEDAADWTPRFPASVRGIEVVDTTGAHLGSWESARPSTSEVCAPPDSGGAFELVVSVPRAGNAPPASVRVTPDLASAVGRQALPAPLVAGSWIRIIEGGGAYVTTTGCGPAGMGSASGPVFGGRSADDDHLFRRERALDGSTWTVRATVSRDLLGFRNGDAGWFFAVAALAALLATLLFRLFLSGVTRSLEQLALAADRIGEGDFSPWLPPPGDDEAGRLSYAIGRMMDRIREMLDKVKRSGQMAAVGEMASHVAHEIRNPLNSLRLNLQSVERAAASGTLDEDDLDSLQTCLREVTRLDRVVSGVLRVTKPASGQVGLTSLHGVIRQATALLKEDLEDRAVVTRFDLGAEGDWIRADAQQIEAALINLMLNAAEAMPDGGQIDLSTQSTVWSGQPAVDFRIADSGPGVPVHLRSRIFDPFFTTKKLGSGLGLAVVMNTVEGHGGHVELLEPSVLGRGATFRIVFPVIVESSELSPAGPRWALGDRLKRKLFAWTRTPDEPQTATPLTLEERLR